MFFLVKKRPDFADFVVWANKGPRVREGVKEKLALFYENQKLDSPGISPILHKTKTLIPFISVSTSQDIIFNMY